MRMSPHAKDLRYSIYISHLSPPVDLNHRLLEDENVPSFQSTFTSLNKHISKHLDSQATLRGNDTGFHDYPLLAREGDN